MLRDFSQGMSQCRILPIRFGLRGPGKHSRHPGERYLALGDHPLGMRSHTIRELSGHGNEPTLVLSASSSTTQCSRASAKNTTQGAS